MGGDLWLSLTVPASGVVRVALGRGATAAGTLLPLGISAYISPDCADPSKFRQVGGHTVNQLALSFPSSATFQINCLTPGETLYLRIHSHQGAYTNQKRYGRFRIAWLEGSSFGTPPANNQPCGATPLTFNTSCPVTPAGGNNFNACSTPGIPVPQCGGFDGSSNDVWYTFIAPPSGIVQLEATAGSSGPANPAMALYSTGSNNCDGRFTLIQCDARMGPGNSALIIRSGLVPGQTYFVRAWAEGAGAYGSFDICITEPVAPAGSCFYLINLWSEVDLNTGSQHMDVTINGGTTTTYSTTPGDLHQQFLVTVPAGANVLFEYYNVGVSWRCYREVYRLGDPTPLWSTSSGGSVLGPAPAPVYTFLLEDACAPLLHPSTDCLGSKTICTELINGTNTVFGTVTGANAPGNQYDLLGTNMGCLTSENNGVEWLIFRPVQDGTVAFWFDGTTNAPTTDLDFAVWDAGYAPYDPVPPNIDPGICAPQGPPVRCSSARRNNSTGLQPGLFGVEQEGSGGWGWLSPLPVQADHVYLIAVVKVSSSNVEVQYQMRWTMFVDPLGTSNPAMLDCTPMTLPVEYLFFQGEQRERMVDLTWATATERNSSHFVVERSTDGSRFTAIGSVEAATNSSMRMDYAFTDTAPFRGMNFYRLKQVDLDGTSEYSSIVVVTFHDGPGQLFLYPIPTSDRLHLTTDIATPGTHMLLISDATGRHLHSQFIEAGAGPLREEIMVNMLAPGAYLLQVVATNGGTVSSARFIKR